MEILFGVVVIILIMHILQMLAILVFKLISLPNKKVIQEIYDLEDIDDNTKAEAVLCMREARRLDIKSLFYDVTAPVVTFYVLLFTSKKANNLPKMFRRWDNNVSLNGDGHWVIREDKSVVDLRDLQWKNFNPETDTLVPYSAEPALGKAYYARWFEPRQFIPRWIFIGIRNRASLYAKELGPMINERPVLLSGSLDIDRKTGGHFLIKYGKNYHYKSLTVGKFLTTIRSYGVKLEYAMKWHDGVKDKVPPVAIGVSYKTSKK
jgi:hypothetical protein